MIARDSATSVLENSERICVLMSVRNGERYLAEAIESVLGQTWRDFTFIIVDDRSTDATPEILKRYAEADPRIRIVEGEGRGLAAALNAGLRRADADFIARMDADDACLPQRLERQIAFLRQNPDVVAAGSSVITIDSSGRRIRTRKAPTEPDAIRRILMTRNPMCHPSVMIRKAALDSAGGYDERFVTSQDYDLWLRLGRQGNIANIAEPLLRYRKHDKRTSDRSNSERQTVYSVAAIARHHLANAGIAPSSDAIDPANPDPVARDLVVLLDLPLNGGGRQALMRHVLRLLRNARALSPVARADLLAAARPHMGLMDRIKGAIYGIG